MLANNYYDGKAIFNTLLAATLVLESMEPFGSILSALGSIASLVAFVAVWKSHSPWLLRLAFIAIFWLTATSSYFSYRYYEATQAEVVREAKRSELRSAAREFLANNASDPSYWNSGENEGVVKSGLILLELYKDVIPESYEKIRSDVEADLAYARTHRDQSAERATMNSAADSMLTTLRMLAGGG